MPPFPGFRFVGGAYSQGVALGYHIFSLSGWYWVKKIIRLAGLYWNLKLSGFKAGVGIQNYLVILLPMNHPTLTREQSRQVDRVATEEFGLSGLVLMENAGRGVADVLCGLGITGPAVICCGKGNNAGDGFIVARHLDLRGHAVRVLLWADPEELTGDAETNFQILKKTSAPIEIFGNRHDPERLAKLLADAAWIVDALLGTGARGEPRPPLDSVIDQLNAAPAPKLAVDLPSGLDCDTGIAARHTIRAAQTCTFVAAKPGFFTPGAGKYVGRLHVLDIGTPRQVIEIVLNQKV
jgi:NAD(P)H-hydrate epimerase